MERIEKPGFSVKQICPRCSSHTLAFDKERKRLRCDECGFEWSLKG